MPAAFQSFWVECCSMFKIVVVAARHDCTGFNVQKFKVSMAAPFKVSGFKFHGLRPFNFVEGFAVLLRCKILRLYNHLLIDLGCERIR